MVVCSCSITDLTVPPKYGFITVSAGGTQLRPGSNDAPTTLDLRLHAEVAFRKEDVVATVDGNPLDLTGIEGDLVASVKPLTLGSAHRLAVAVAGREPIYIDFSVIPPTGAMLAAHTDSGAVVVDGSFAGAPDQAAVAAALPGATPAWTDVTHVRLTWAGGVPPALDLPATIPTARGAHLAADMHLDLGGLGPGALRRATVPAAPAVRGVKVTAFVVDTSASNTSLAAHLGAIDTVAATGWQAQADGSLLGTPDPPATARAQSAGVPLWPSLGNDANNPAATTALLGNPNAVAQVIGTVVQAAQIARYKGINVDFEGMAATDKAPFTAFVQGLAAACHARGIPVMVDVVPHDTGGVNRYSAAYDVPAIGAAVDLVDVMAYDQHASGTVPGPVAGLDWDQAQLAATLSGLKPDHVLLGIPLYARGWQDGTGSAGAYSEAVGGALLEPGARVGFDFGAATPYVVSADGSGVTYFDDADSLARKIALVHAQGLAGVAAWRLGFEDPNFWGLFR